MTEWDEGDEEDEAVEEDEVYKFFTILVTIFVAVIYNSLNFHKIKWQIKATEIIIKFIFLNGDKYHQIYHLIWHQILGITKFVT